MFLRPGITILGIGLKVHCWLFQQIFASLLSGGSVVLIQKLILYF